MSRWLRPPHSHHSSWSAQKKPRRLPTTALQSAACRRRRIQYRGYGCGSWFLLKDSSSYSAASTSSAFCAFLAALRHRHSVATTDHVRPSIHRQPLTILTFDLTLCGHIKTAEQRTVIQQYGDWYTGRWWVGCYIWYSEEGPWRAAVPPSPLLAVSQSTHQRPVSQLHIIRCDTVVAFAL